LQHIFYGFFVHTLGFCLKKRKFNTSKWNRPLSFIPSHTEIYDFTKTNITYKSF